MSLMGFSVLAGVLFAALVSLTIWSFGRRSEDVILTPAETQPTVTMLFKDAMLLDADDLVWPLLNSSVSETPDWDEVRKALLAFVPDLPKTMPTTPLIMPHTAGPRVEFHVIDHTVRLSLVPSHEAQIDWFTALKDASDLTQLELALRYSPNPIWCLGKEGDVIWGNEAFEQLAKTHGGTDAFAKHITGLMGECSTSRARRISLASEESRQNRWYEVTTRETDSGVLHFATGVDAVVQAEEAQRNFVQTLSKTFANLTTGLAIFDRNRRLALFNPALIDLCGLSAEFLSGRPNLFEFFDKLRDLQIMPEPKNYDNWRECMAKLVAAADDDRFRETWNLVSGQTFDLTGRPYPDGAIAFLFNDITAEVSLTRGFRTELETMQSSLDAMEDAVAIFSQQGVLTVCNATYKSLWNVDPDTCIEDATIVDATQEWKSAFHPAPVWPELRDFVTNTQERASWDCDLRSIDGREVICRVDPICYGSTMIRFCHPPARRKGSSDTEPLQIVSA